jgi:hypothetical protein
MNLVSHLADPSLGVVLLGDAGRGTHSTPPHTQMVGSAAPVGRGADGVDAMA